MLDATAVKTAEVADDEVFFHQVAVGTLVEGDAATPLDAAVSVDLVVSDDNIVVIGIESRVWRPDGNAAGVVALVVCDVVVADLQAHGTADGEDAAPGFRPRDGEPVNGRLAGHAEGIALIEELRFSSWVL